MLQTPSFALFPHQTPPFVLFPFPVSSFWARFVPSLFALSSSPVPTAHKTFSPNPALLMSFQKLPMPLLCSPLLLPLTSCSPSCDAHISAHFKEGANISPTDTSRMFNCGLPATGAILFLHLSPASHGWAATQTSTLTPWTFSRVNFQPNKWDDLIHPAASCARSTSGDKGWPEVPRRAGEEKWASPFCQHCRIRVAKQDHTPHPGTNWRQGDAIWLL